MYTLDYLQQKSLKELKEIGRELNVLPEGDRRYRENWINAIAGVNPPLLQLLEVSPGPEVEQVQPIIETVEPSPGVEPETPLESKFGRIVYPRPAQKAIVQSVETSPGVEVGQAQGAIKVQATEAIEQATEIFPGVEVDSVQDPKEDSVICWQCEGDGKLSDAGVFWDCYACEGTGLLSQSLLEQKGDEVLQFYYGTTDARKAFERLKKEQEATAEAAKAPPGVEVDQTQGSIEVQSQDPIVPAAETSPGVEVDPVHRHKFLLCLKDGHNTLWYDGKNFVCEKWSAKSYCKRGVGSAKYQLSSHPEVKRLRNLQVVENSSAHQKPIEVQAQEPILQSAKTSPGVEADPVIEPISQVAKTSPGVEVDPAEDELPKCVDCFDDGFFEEASGVIKICHCSSEPKLSRQNAQRAIVPEAKNLPGSRSKTSTAHQLLELFKSSAHIIEDSPGGEAEGEVSQSAIEQPAKNQESDLNPILTGLSLSNRFLARYSPPQAEVFQFQADADGQLSLIDFEVQSQPEPPDPDDFESLDAFREAIALWDAQNPEPLTVSLDSMCEWAPCPEEWYEPKAEILPLKASSMIELPEQSEVMELSIIGDSSITSDFFIPTFGSWGDRLNRSDEPPDTQIFARLPKPKPPNFPPQASWTQVGHQLDTSQPKSAQVRLSQASRNYPETIPKLFHCSVAGRSNQPARSPPGGDA